MSEKQERKGKPLEQIADQLGVGRFEMHFFLCTGPDCCTEEEGMASWKALKSKVKELNPVLRDARMYRTKVGCLRMCTEGPVAVCYPQGKWFRGVTADQVGDVVAHLQSGNEAPHPLEFVDHPLRKS